MVALVGRIQFLRITSRCKKSCGELKMQMQEVLLLKYVSFFLSFLEKEFLSGAVGNGVMI
jgi:hypothetical protein